MPSPGPLATLRGGSPEPSAMLPLVRRTRRIRRTLATCLLLGVAGCASRARNPFAAPGTAETQVTVVMENRGFNDIRVYALTSGGVRSLGGVGGNTQRRAAIEWRHIEQLSFRIEVLAGRTYTTLGISVSPGDRIYLVVPDDPSRAYTQVR